MVILMAPAMLSAPHKDMLVHGSDTLLLILMTVSDMMMSAT
jgi:hypothetical protein